MAQFLAKRGEAMATTFVAVRIMVQLLLLPCKNKL
jgi:hypothetical protein